MSQITHEQFLADVRHEVETIKKLATPEEISRLKFKRFNPDSKSNCIYGQMTGDCRSIRACDLLSSACVRVTHNRKVKLHESTFEEILEVINGPLKGRMKDDLNYISMLETYILLKDSKSKNIMDYLKGKTETLEL